MWHSNVGDKLDMTPKVIGEALENIAVLLWAHPHEVPVNYWDLFSKPRRLHDVSAWFWKYVFLLSLQIWGGYAIRQFWISKLVTD